MATSQTSSILPKAPQPQGAVDPVTLLRLEVLSSFRNYVKVMFRAAYKRSFVFNTHHDQIIEALERVVDGKCKRLIINIAPRYSKTELVIKMFVSYCYALNAACNFLHLSYSDLLVNDNSAAIRDIMKLDIYKELFPDTVLEKPNKAATEKWRTTAGGEMYAVSTQGQVTGFGAGRVDDETNDELDEQLRAFDDAFLRKLGLIGANTNVFNGALLIDDPLKPEDAQSDVQRERVNNRFETTIRNRVNSRNVPIIIIMQRLHEHDLCGYLLELEPEDWEVLSIPTIQIDPETGEEKALWPFKHTLEELHKLRRANSYIFDTQYMQEPTPKEGLMYSDFGTYTSIPQEPHSKRCNYTDTADTGADFLCSINFTMTELYNYITDVYYTTEPMEVTEPETAALLHKGRIQEARIESNNGGRGFARNVMRLLRTLYRNFSCKITWFYQSQNKQVRIFTNSAEVNNVTLMPEGWEKRWPKFYEAVTKYRKENNKKSVHDDAVDALTGTYEMRAKVQKNRKLKQRNRSNRG